MNWTDQQDRALKAVAEWLADPNGPQVFRLFGFAGTGKTTLARHFAEGVDGLVLFMAFTGKAAHVLLQKGCVGATTVHSSIYHTKDKGRAKLKDLEAELGEVLMELHTIDLANDTVEDRKRFTDENKTVITLRAKIEAERGSLSRPTFSLNHDSAVGQAKLVVVDEVSMIDDLIGSDLVSFGTKILVLGDPFQLPPVAGAGFFTKDVEPDIMLTDIRRQAKDNPIIAMATMVREDNKLPKGDFGDSRVVDKARINEKDALAADQILVGRNKTRHSYNRRMRLLLGHEDVLPVLGDRLVCLRNNHDKGLLNGAIWYVDDVGEIGDERVYMTVHPEDGGLALELEAHSHYFIGNEGNLGWWERKDAEEFDYGYALTVHKSQGSQWNNVLLFDESYCFRKDRWRWLYTGITRAAEKITVVDL